MQTNKDATGQSTLQDGHDTIHRRKRLHGTYSSHTKLQLKEGLLSLAASTMSKHGMAFLCRTKSRQAGTERVIGSEWLTKSRLILFHNVTTTNSPKGNRHNNPCEQSTTTVSLNWLKIKSVCRINKPAHCIILY